jgi:hypothetical protein
MLRKSLRPLRIATSGAAIALLSLVHPSGANAPPGRYSIVNGTVADLKTGLTWEQNISQIQYPMASSTETTAPAYCASLHLNGTAPWRLPTIKELLTLVDVKQGSPAIDTSAFPSTPADFFYSATQATFLPGITWTVDFNTGLANGTTSAPNFKEYVRCVR